MHSEKIDQIIPALIAAENEFDTIKKDKNVDVSSSMNWSYITLKSLFSAVKPSLKQNGLKLIFTMGNIDTKQYLHCWLMHTSGQYLRSSMELTLNWAKPQVCGSVITYMKRYMAMAILGVAEEETISDDKINEAATEMLQQKENPAQAPAPKADVKPLLDTMASCPGLEETWNRVRGQYGENLERVEAHQVPAMLKKMRGYIENYKVAEKF